MGGRIGLCGHQSLNLDHHLRACIVIAIAIAIMAALTPAGQDRILMFGLGVVSCGLLGLMRHMLVHYRNAAIEKPVRNKPQYITQEVEDSLKLSTLEKLLNSPSYGIQETTALIITERALHDGTSIDALLWHITQPDHETREKGIRALAMMMNNCKCFFRSC